MKENNKVVFYLSKNEAIVFELGCSLTDIGPCDDIDILFQDNDMSFRLTHDCLLYLTREFLGKLELVLSDRLSLDPSINEDIGYLYNKELHGEPGFVYTEQEGQKFWIGGRNLLFSTPGCSTWFYNDGQGKIVLQITPNYLWHFSKPKKNDNFTTYDEFMKNYTSTATYIISHITAKQWLQQIKNLLENVEAKLIAC